MGNDEGTEAMSVGIIGAGNMGRSIATQLGKTARRIVLADRNPVKAEAVVARIGAGDRVRAGDVADALASDVIVLALWHRSASEFAAEHAAELREKIVVDISNPLDDSWIRLWTDPSTSSAELLAGRLPESRIVKAFNTMLAPAPAAGQVDGNALDILLAGNDEAAKSQIGQIVRSAGLRPVDAGSLDDARLLERLAAFEIELSQRYDRGFRLSFEGAPAALAA